MHLRVVQVQLRRLLLPTCVSALQLITHVHLHPHLHTRQWRAPGCLTVRDCVSPFL